MRINFFEFHEIKVLRAVVCICIGKDTKRKRKEKDKLINKIKARLRLVYTP
jgi:hypothetical protein